MILFFESSAKVLYALESLKDLTPADLEKLTWLFGNASQINSASVEGKFLGPRKEMITPWSTNAVEITQNMGIDGIIRIEDA